ncbi:carbohydrate ABC transporter substrate-binding protein, CUT1 family (TC 3.A.1.1.-) [Marinitoga hydrogenitolerans DSM 16785]|uniref:Carbohydrate ABC transporter substrate-binding protein, CUT1 family (TC 3.A.1.1.-) n=1 Tax=Marinitoga hydrogenitolerans (strain DSM 16785 / JCM 12826 / AT1271) TaxID=1122195 RepID=A0A1M4XFB1_MARH1|nr:sugar ABC transporter substrate-binding protein [Marinitoga hydrogenitolerans]SHE92199.1 carbohydrate ABC transporter substrate-binding protein, CUT1 family (TC 3.A.1.1.-) [Marinitoga hydrogenitolerans DSM 16785]
MKKLFLIISIILISLFVFSEEVITLNLIEAFSSPWRTPTLNKIIEMFETLNPGVKINVISPPYETAYQKINLMVSTEQPLDIVEIGDWNLSTLAAMGKLEDLTPYIDNWSEKNDLIDGVLEAASIYKNTPYLLPHGIFVKTLFYRPDILSKYGFKNYPKTMQEMYDMAKKLTESGKNQYGFDFRGKGYPTAFIDIVVTSFFDDIDPNNMYLTKDGKLIFDDPRAIEGLNFYVSLFKDTAPKDSVNWGWDEQVNAFVSGITPLLFQDPDTTGMLNEMLKPGQYKTAPLPLGLSGKAYPTFGFVGWGIPTYSKHKDLAWKFIKFVSSSEINGYWSKSYGALPILKSVYKYDSYFSSNIFEGWTEMFKDPEHYQFTQYPLDNENWGKWNEFQEKTMQQVLLGKLSVVRCLKQWSDFWKDAGIK